MKEVELEAIDDQEEAAADHPDRVSDEEAEEGRRLWESIKDLDDEAEF